MAALSMVGVSTSISRGPSLRVAGVTTAFTTNELAPTALVAGATKLSLTCLALGSGELSCTPRF